METNFIATRNQEQQHLSLLFHITEYNFVMRHKKQSESRIQKKVETKNQQRCLNSDSIVMKRAYLNTKKRSSKVYQIQDHFDFPGSCHHEEKNDHPPLPDNSEQSQPFDPQIINQKMSKIHEIISKIEKNSNQRKQNNTPIHKFKTQYNTQPDTLLSYSESPKNSDNKHYRKQADKVQKDKKQLSHQSLNKRGHHSEHKKMVKVKSNKNKLKVYNPFPVPLTDDI